MGNMSNFPYTYFLSAEFVGKTSPEAVVVYFILRSDISENNTATAKLLKYQEILGSGLTVQSIAQISNLSEITVKRCLYNLAQLGWVKKTFFQDDVQVYQLGVIEDYQFSWFIELETPKRKRGVKETDKIRKVLAERKKKKEEARREKVTLSRDKKREIATDTLGSLLRQPRATKTLLEYFKLLYFSKYKKIYKVAAGLKLDAEIRKEHQKIYAYLSRFLKFCGEDIHKGKEIFKFVFNNWDKIKLELKWEGDITLNLFGTLSILNRVKTWQELGFKKKVRSDGSTGLATRYDPTKSGDDPDEGF